MSRCLLAMLIVALALYVSWTLVVEGDGYEPRDFN